MARVLFRPRFAIEKKTGVTETISSEVDNNVLLFRHCKDSCFTLTGSAIKIVMDHCENLRLVLDKDGKSILAGTLEIVHCKKVVVLLENPDRCVLPTICLDLSDEIQIQVQNSSCLHNVISAIDCTNLSVSLLTSSPVKTFPILVPDNLNSQKLVPGVFGHEESESPTQLISRFSAAGGYETKLVTEVVVREGVGHITTKREKEFADERDRRFGEKLKEVLSSSLSSSPAAPAPASST